MARMGFDFVWICGVWEYFVNIAYNSKCLEFEWTTRNFVFRFETERVLSIQKPSGIWTHIATMQNILKSSNLNFINLIVFLLKIKISFKILKINKIWKFRKINFCLRWDLNPRPLDFRDQTRRGRRKLILNVRGRSILVYWVKYLIIQTLHTGRQSLAQRRRNGAWSASTHQS